jgi:hypothetical protein
VGHSIDVTSRDHVGDDTTIEALCAALAWIMYLGNTPPEHVHRLIGEELGRLREELGD